MLDLRRLRLLRELAERGTITAVAEAHSYSPSAVSQQLATLEREAGVRLLEPIGRRVRLTSAGELLVDRAQVLLEHMERTEAEVAKAARGDGALQGTLRVAAFQSAVLALVPDALSTLIAQHPKLRVEVTELEPEAALPALSAGIFDIVLAEEYPGNRLALSPSTERHDLMTDELRLVVPSDWSKSRVSDLADRPFVLEPVGTTSREWATAMCRQAGVEPDVRFTSTNLQIHLRLVASGLAVALLPGLSGARAFDGVTTHRLPGCPHRQIVVVSRRGSGADPRLTTFSDALIRVGTAT